MSVDVGGRAQVGAPRLTESAPMKASKSVSSSRSTTPRVHLAEGGFQHLLGYQLAQASILTTRTFGEIVGKPLDLRKVEYTALQLIGENDGVTATQLAKALAITVPGITTWLDRLEMRGLIVRERGGLDRRTQHLRTTEAGHQLLTAALGRLLEAEAGLLQHLSPGERQLLLELLHKFARASGLSGARKR